MTDDLPPGRLAVPIGDVEVGRLLGEGGEARVYEAEYAGGDPELGATRTFAAKVFTGSRANRSLIAAVNTLASLRPALRSRDKDISSRLNVPLRVLADADELVGYLLPMLGPQFMRTGARFAAEDGAPRVAERLFLGREMATSVGLCYATLTHRLTVCLQLAQAFELVHGLGYVYGDLSGRNVLYSLWPSVEVVLLDCESLRPTGSAASNPQMTTPGWTQPGRLALSQVTDQAKVSTFMLRTLSPGVGADRANDPSRLRGASILGDQDGRLPEIFRRAQGSVTAAQWVAWISAALRDVGAHEGWTRGRKGDWLRIR